MEYLTFKSVEENMSKKNIYSIFNQTTQNNKLEKEIDKEGQTAQ